MCKPLDSLISNDLKFASNHLRLSPKRQHLITTSWKIVKHLTIFSSPFDPFNIHSTFTNVPTLLDYYCPVIPDSCDGLVASCDGLLCFVIDKRSVALYNPSIRKVKKLPCLVLPQLKVQGSTLFAFGYDPYVHNYKVVALFWYMYRSYMDTPKIQVEVHTYTLGTDSWKMIKDFPSMFCFSRFESLKYGVFVSGTVNWLAYHRLSGNATVVSLHLGTESFQEISQPDYGNLEILSLEVIRDCLCLFTQESSNSDVIDVWLMKEYRNKESCIKTKNWCTYRTKYMFKP